MNSNSKQVAGTHYKTDGLQHWDIIAGQNIGYLEGCCTKYLIRWRKKNGLQDLQKAEHFLEKLIEMVESGQIKENKARINNRLMEEFYETAKIHYPESLIVHTVLRWQNVGVLKSALVTLKNLILEFDCDAGPGYVNQDR